ncbi:hypothetical protein OSB04_028876 [Centaurea solstitialis]|uniref:J domain-containing protein n=1 Tax=Centaurea solstitialis TaxID=347529 RepID=A0AA38SGM4_9ASTR|nr:hypothetical protein OSB04_028876 [Centaurea solstitialis]
MAVSISTSSSFFTISSPHFTFNSRSSLQPASNSVRFGRAPISAAYSTAERTTTEPMRSFWKPNPLSLYEVLGIRIGADAKEVKAAYRRLARVLHPDVVGNGDSSADEFMKVQSAYAKITDPQKRADYDRSLVQRRVGVSSPVRCGGGYKSHQRWETDQCW